MRTQGIRISNGKDHVLNINLSDVLQEIPNGNSLYWSIQFLSGTPNPGEGGFLIEYEHQINKSEHGLIVKWEDLISLSAKFFQMFETIILGSNNINLLHRYENDEEMCEHCDVVIILVDCAFWEVYAKNKNIIENLKNKFPQHELPGHSN